MALARGVRIAGSGVDAAVLRDRGSHPHSARSDLSGEPGGAADGFPRTDPEPKQDPVPDPCYFLWSAATIWIVLHLVVACVAAICVSADPVKAIGACLAGVLLTGLAFLAWERITRSFMALLWDTCRFTDPEALAALLKGQIPARMKK